MIKSEEMNFRNRLSAFLTSVAISATLFLGFTPPTPSSAITNSKVIAEPSQNPSQSNAPQMPRSVFEIRPIVAYKQNNLLVEQGESPPDPDSAHRLKIFLCTWKDVRRFEHDPVHKPPWRMVS
jgi:hypothetical protein